MCGKVMLQLIVVFISGAIFSCVVQAGIWNNSYCVQDDVMQYLLAFSNSAGLLPPEDLISQYSYSWNTPGTRVLYQYVSRFIDPVIFSKILPPFLSGCTAVFVYLIGKKICSVGAGVSAVWFLLSYAWSSHVFSGGHPRSFAYPLLTGGVYFLLKGKYWLVMMMIMLSVVFYPQIGLLMVPVSIGWFVMMSDLYQKREYAIWRKYYLITGLMGLVVLMIWLMSLLPEHAQWGGLFSLDEMKKMPEFGQAGRCPFFLNWRQLFSDPVAVERVVGFDFLCPAGIILAGFGTVGFYAAFRRQVAVHPLFLLVLLTAFFWYCVSWPAMLQAFFPGRFLKFVLPFTLALTGALLIECCMVVFRERERLCLRLVIIVLTGAVIFPGLKKDFVCYSKPELYAFMKGLPKASLVAGHPREMDEITVLSGKKVFLTEELSLPFYRKYYQEIAQRTRDFFLMYYATEWEEVSRISKLYGIRYIVVRQEHFSTRYIMEQLSKKEGAFYLEPFSQYIKELVRKGEKKFVFSSIPEKLKVYSGGGYFVVDMEAVLMK